MRARVVERALHDSTTRWQLALGEHRFPVSSLQFESNQVIFEGCPSETASGALSIWADDEMVMADAPLSAEPGNLVRYVFHVEASVRA